MHIYDIRRLAELALRGNWSPLFNEARRAPGHHWTDRAACAGRSTEQFFDPGDDPVESPNDAAEKRARTRLTRALNICAECPLSTAAHCLLDSVRADDAYGVRGGLTATERRALRRIWQKRVDETAVEAVLQGRVTAVTKAERKLAIARLADSPEIPRAVAARGLEMEEKYLRKLVDRKTAA